MDIAQIVITVSLTVVTTVLVFCGVYVILLLKELRIAVNRAVGILDDTKQITESVARPVSSFSDFVMGFKNGLKVFNSFFKEKEK